MPQVNYQVEFDKLCDAYRATHSDEALEQLIHMYNRLKSQDTRVTVGDDILDVLQDSEEEEEDDDDDDEDDDEDDGDDEDEEEDDDEEDDDEEEEDDVSLIE
jgi:hypothetical protein